MQVLKFILVVCEHCAISRKFCQRASGPLSFFLFLLPMGGGQGRGGNGGECQHDGVKVPGQPETQSSAGHHTEDEKNGLEAD